MSYPRTALGFKDSVNSLGGYSSYSTGDLTGASDDEVLDGYERVSSACQSASLGVNTHSTATLEVPRLFSIADELHRDWGCTSLALKCSWSSTISIWT